MDKRINFEDCLFVLNVRLRMIQDALILDVDSGLFLAKTVDDLGFIDTTLACLFEKLGENQRLLERDEQFFNLFETERIYCDLLFELSKGKTGLSAALGEELVLKLSDMRNRSFERRKSINEVIAAFKTTKSEPVVGSDELHELLSI